MGSLIMELDKRVTEAREGLGQEIFFKVSLANGVTVYWQRHHDQHFVGYMMYRPPSEPLVDHRYVSLSNNNESAPKLMDESEGAKLDFFTDMTEVVAFMEIASKLSF